MPYYFLKIEGLRKFENAVDLPFHFLLDPHYQPSLNLILMGFYSLLMFDRVFIQHHLDSPYFSFKKLMFIFDFGFISIAIVEDCNSKKVIKKEWNSLTLHLKIISQIILKM